MTKKDTIELEPELQDVPKEEAIVVAASALPEPAPDEENPYLPKGFREAMEMAEMLSKSALTPKHLQGDPGGCFQIMATASAIGIKWPIAFREMFPVHGSVSFSANLLGALAQTDQAFRLFDITESTDTTATITAQKHVWDEPQTYTVTIEDARKAGYCDGKHSVLWKTRPRTMLAHMATREASRLWSKARMLGIYSPEEVEANIIDVSPEPAQQPAESKVDAFVKEQKAAKPRKQRATKAEMEARRAAEKAEVEASEDPQKHESAQEPEPAKTREEVMAIMLDQPQPPPLPSETKAKQQVAEEMMTRQHYQAIYETIDGAFGSGGPWRVSIFKKIESGLGLKTLFRDASPSGDGYKRLEVVPDILFDKTLDWVKDLINIVNQERSEQRGPIDEEMM